jgi:hypothetical protein
MPLSKHGIRTGCGLALEKHSLPVRALLSFIPDFGADAFRSLPQSDILFWMTA